MRNQQATPQRILQANRAGLRLRSTFFELGCSLLLLRVAMPTLGAWFDGPTLSIVNSEWVWPMLVKVFQISCGALAGILGVRALVSIALRQWGRVEAATAEDIAVTVNWQKGGSGTRLSVLGGGGLVVAGALVLDIVVGASRTIDASDSGLLLFWQAWVLSLFEISAGVLMMLGAVDIYWQAHTRRQAITQGDRQ